MKEFEKLLVIMAKLLGKDGCPWDIKQSHDSLLKYLREEVKEFEAAVKKKDIENMKEELGDILLQVVFHCELARKEKYFDIKQVISTLNDKLIIRHPHVFLKRKKISASEVIRQWNRIKKKEKAVKRGINDHRK